jgi:hypothetical protein
LRLGSPNVRSTTAAKSQPRRGTTAQRPEQQSNDSSCWGFVAFSGNYLHAVSSPESWGVQGAAGEAVVVMVD